MWNSRKWRGLEAAFPFVRHGKNEGINIHTLPVTRDGKLEGVITIGDIAKTYMEVYDSMILSKARTQYRNIARAVEGEVLTGNEHSYLLKGKV